ncbi:oxidative damage protection protein [Alkalilimnicola sp. S0819]|uniref:oxidative damage protection protein n=1 Tax=Alkalilimnicola sp. S0819 TaxID=2613922 RepID=UPI001261B4E9|nr:oxidative damage protection protein [Alkalilimnicola sp. S0819]KAB7623391.1 oxidative damage protection protein [Alkalilimnicola sp. S0819]MPQ16935.1 oxidative damage protection protein [Alkalilimnicola sp. S0819]
MTRTVQCAKLGREAEGLDRVPYPGELGKRVYESVSKEAWQAWLGQQTMLINEYRLSPMDPKARKFLEGEMEQFFFGGGSAAPPDYQPR